MEVKLISEFLSLGCTKRDAAVALQVYLELCEVKRYWDVEYKFNSSMNLLYFMAKKLKISNLSIFIPWAANVQLNLEQMVNFLGVNDHDLAEQKSVYVVFVSPDSTCVYYQLTDGLLEPTDSTPKHLKENPQEKIDAAIKKNRTLIEQAALCNLPITLPKTKAEEK